MTLGPPPRRRAGGSGATPAARTSRLGTEAGARWTARRRPGTVGAMTRLLPALTAAAVLATLLAVAGCATTGPDRLVRERPRVPLDRANGQPRLLPCMIGDTLCTP